jgi:hypothetical protein
MPESKPKIGKSAVPFSFSSTGTLLRQSLKHRIQKEDPKQLLRAFMQTIQTR